MLDTTARGMFVNHIAENEEELPASNMLKETLPKGLLYETNTNHTPQHPSVKSGLLPPRAWPNEPPSPAQIREMLLSLNPLGFPMTSPTEAGGQSASPALSGKCPRTPMPRKAPWAEGSSVTLTTTEQPGGRSVHREPALGPGKGTFCAQASRGVYAL